MLQRACARVGLDMIYSQGFNPRPKISLPLPRTVGVESEDDLLFLQLKNSPENAGAALSGQLPEGCAVSDVSYPGSTKTPQPVRTVYVIPVKEGKLGGLNEKGEQILNRKSIVVHRPHKKGKNRQKEIRGFIDSIQLEGNKIAVKCRITNKGSVRVEELMDLLGIKTDDLEGAIVRTCPEWKNFS